LGVQPLWRPRLRTNYCCNEHRVYVEEIETIFIAIRIPETLKAKDDYLQVHLEEVKARETTHDPEPSAPLSYDMFIQTFPSIVH
jgi:hypothetical protein